MYEAQILVHRSCDGHSQFSFLETRLTTQPGWPRTQVAVEVRGQLVGASSLSTWTQRWRRTECFNFEELNLFGGQGLIKIIL